MRTIFVCPAIGTSDETIDAVVIAAQNFSGNEDVYVREFDAANEYLSVIGITKTGQTRDVVLNWGNYTELAYILVGVDKCDGVVFCGDWEHDSVCVMLYKMLAEDGFQKSLYHCEGDKLFVVKVKG